MTNNKETTSLNCRIYAECLLHFRRLNPLFVTYYYDMKKFRSAWTIR